MADVEVRDILLRCGGRTLQRTGFLAAMGAGRGYVEVKETFTRADATTCRTFMDRDMGSGQFLRLAEANKVRIEYPTALSGLVDAFGYPYCGPLLEGTRKNIAHFTRDLTNAFWTKESSDTVTADAGQAADGSVTADKVVEFAATSIHGFNRSFACAAGDSLCWSAVVEAAGRNVFQMMVRSDAEVNGFRGQFDASTGVYTPQTVQGTGTLYNGGMIKLRNGKYRAWISGKVDPAATAALARLNYNNPAGTISYLGDGASGMIISDMQFEVGTFPSSIIPALAGSDVTGAADSSILLPFNQGPVDMTVLTRIARPVWVDIIGDVLIGSQQMGRIGGAGGPNIDWGGRSAIRDFYSRANNFGGLATGTIPAGSALSYSAQFKNLTTGGQTALDAGSGLSVFTSAATAFTKYGVQTVEVGLILYGVLLDMIIARGLRTKAEMEAIP